MDKKKEIPKRKPTRLKDFDYNSVGAYFLTICTENRRKILSRIVGVDVLDDPQCDVSDPPSRVELLPYGIIANKYINQLNDFYNDIKVDRYVIMPNHIHILLFVLENGSSGTPDNGSSRTSDNGSSRTSTPTKQHSTVSRFISTFKRFCNKEYGTNIWQRHFNDHIIRNHVDYEEHVKYIYENPIRWYYDELYNEE